MNVVHMVQADVQTTHRCTTAVNNMREMKHCDHFDMSCSDLDCLHALHLFLACSSVTTMCSIATRFSSLSGMMLDLQLTPPL